MTETKDTKSSLNFPCDFVIKIFGVPSEILDKTVIEIVTRHYPDFDGSTISRRPSKDGKYVAFSFSVYVESQEQLDNIYRDLTAHPLILMAL